MEQYIEAILPARQSGRRLRRYERVQPATQESNVARHSRSTVTTPSEYLNLSTTSNGEAQPPVAVVLDNSDHPNHGSQGSKTALRTEESVGIIPKAGYLIAQSPGGSPALAPVQHDTHWYARRRKKRTAASKHYAEQMASSEKPQHGGMSLTGATGQDGQESRAETTKMGHDLFEVAFADDQWSLKDDDHSDNQDEVEEKTNQYHATSAFHPVAGVVGSFLPRWHSRHKRSESP